MDMLNRIITDPAIGRIFTIAISCILIFVLINIIKKSLSKHIKADNWYKTKKAVNISGYILAFLLIVTVYSDRLNGITVALGVAGAGIAFALQEVITSIAGWIAIMAGGFYRTGERVQVGGIKGDVIDLGVLRTTVMELGQWVDGDLYNGRIVRIANSFVFKEPVFNYSSDFPFLWDEIKIPVKFGSDYNIAREILEKVTDNVTGDYARQAQSQWDEMVRKFNIEDAATSTMVTMNITDNWIEFTLRYVVDYRRRRLTQNELFTQILNEVSNSKGLVQLASATLNITEIPTINVANAKRVYARQE